MDKSKLKIIIELTAFFITLCVIDYFFYDSISWIGNLIATGALVVIDTVYRKYLRKDKKTKKKKRK